MTDDADEGRDQAVDEYDGDYTLEDIAAADDDEPLTEEEELEVIAAHHHLVETMEEVDQLEMESVAGVAWDIVNQMGTALLHGGSCCSRAGCIE